MVKILIVEDSNFTQSILLDILAKIGYKNVISANLGKEAFKLFTTQKPNLVLLDLRLPDMDGISVLAKIRSQNKNCKVIIVSAVTSKSKKQECESLGISGYFGKPINEKLLAKKIKEVLN